MNTHESLGVVYWNTWYRANPTEQLKHVEKLDDKLRNLGAAAVIFCLSEVSATGKSEKPGLFERLNETEFNPYYTTVSILSRWSRKREGLVVASRDINLAHEEFFYQVNIPLHKQQALKNEKLRQATRIHLPEIDVIAAHLSYPRPNEEEIAGLLQVAQQIPCHERAGNHAKVIGGDFSTVISKEIVGRFEEAGLVKLRDPNHTSTWSVRPHSRLASELDHVFVTENIAHQASLEIGDQGPSNHNPLLVMITS